MKKFLPIGLVIALLLFAGCYSNSFAQGFTPEGDKYYSFVQKASGLLFSRSVDGTLKPQLRPAFRSEFEIHAFKFVPAGLPGQYFILNKKNEYLYQSSWNMFFDTTYNAAKEGAGKGYRFTIKTSSDAGYYEIGVVSLNRVVGSDGTSFGSPLFADKPSTDKARWTIVNSDSVNYLETLKLLVTGDGIIDHDNRTVANVSPSLTVEKFRSGLRVLNFESSNIIDEAAGVVIQGQDTTLLSNSMAVQITGPEGTSLYSIQLREISAANAVISSSLGAVDQAAKKIKFLPREVRVSQLRSALEVSPFATFRITDAQNSSYEDFDLIHHKMLVIVTAENGAQQTYRVHIANSQPIVTEIKTNYTDTLEVLRNTILTLQGKCSLSITATADPLEGSLLKLNSEDVWIYFPNIKPSTLNEKYLSQIQVNCQPAVIDQNIRLEQYLQGSVVISHPAEYQALTVFTGENLSGSSKKFGNYTYNRAAELGELNNGIKSFKLKKGYMATFAGEENGTGFSRVFISDENDIVIDKLPEGLYDQISFVRVIPWRWVAKKGWTSGLESAEALNTSWQYDWNNEATSGLNVEYIPMRHNRWWNSYENINNKLKSTHALGFNEPDRPDQANMTVEQALAAWPELLKSGLRLGSPSPSDNGAALNWLYEFIDRADQLNYRVDFIAVHWYKGGQTPEQFYNWLKAIHVRTKRPIWITEWNNGANWTCCKPTYAEQANAIGKFIHMLDTASFVERYSLYEWVQDTRQMFYKAPVLLTPAGEVYKDNLSPMAYNPAKAFVPTYIKPVPPFVPVENQYYSFTQKASGLLFGQSQDGNRRPQLRAITINEQETHALKFVQSDTPGQYYVLNKKGEFLYQNSWNMYFHAAIDATLVNATSGYKFWVRKSVEPGYFEIVTASLQRIIGSDNVLAGSALFADKASNDMAKWTMQLAEELEYPDGELQLATSRSQDVLFPNPVQHELTILTDLPEDEEIKISVHSFTGEPVVIPASQNRQTLDVSRLPKGVYYLKICKKDNVVMSRFVKQ